MKIELVTTLKRKATQLIEELNNNHDPVLITQHGKPAAVLIDVETYQKMNRRMSILEGIALGERAVLEGRVFSHREAKKRLAKWLR